MGKYIVELKKNETLYKAATRESDGTAYVCSAIGTPYTEPDLEQINREKDALYDEARARGYDEGRARGYQEGLFDAWEVARKIAKLDTDEQKRLFGCFGIYFVAHEFSASEAIEKIRQYEQEKEEIHLWDEVINGRNFKGTVFNIEDNGMLTIFGQDGTWTMSHARYWKKTGRHFHEIAEVLQKMKESDNG